MDRLALLEREVGAMGEALRTSELSAPVTACPGWTVRELAAHVTGIHRWVLAALSSDQPPTYDERVGADPVADYVAAAQAMLVGLRALPPEHSCWTFDRDNRTAGFWRRRQLHEVAVHRWDVAAYALTDEVAADGIDEVLDFMLPRQLATGRITLPDGTLELRTAQRTWTVGTGASTVVEGDASELLLRLWGRGAPLPTGWAGLTP